MNPFHHAILADTNQVINVSEVGETLAYTWFGRPNWAYSEAAQKYWIGSTNDTPEGTTQHITEYDITSNIYTTTRVGTVYQKDDHNQTQILIRASDSRLIAFYVEHSGTFLRWRISTNPLDSKSWGNEITSNPVGAYSYISPYQASNGDIFIFFRSRSGSTSIWYYMKSIDNGETFSAAINFFEAGQTHNYLISSQDGNKVHFTASNGHPQSNSNTNINTYHFYFDLITATGHLSNGTSIALPLTPASITLVNTTTGSDTSWILDVICKNGNPRILYAFYPNGRSTSVNFKLKELYFIEWNGTAWVNKKKISNTLYGYIENGSGAGERAYTGASRFDTSNPDIIWMPKEVDGILEIHKVDLIEDTIEQLTFNSNVNNWRPISVPSPVNNLLWLKNNYYNSYTDYDISLQTLTVQLTVDLP